MTTEKYYSVESFKDTTQRFGVRFVGDKGFLAENMAESDAVIFAEAKSKVATNYRLEVVPMPKDRARVFLGGQEIYT